MRKTSKYKEEQKGFDLDPWQKKIIGIAENQEDRFCQQKENLRTIKA